MQARAAVMDILEKCDGGKVGLTELAKELHRRRILGFGVEVEDVVSALVRQHKVSFDKETEMVSLLDQEEARRLTEEERRRELQKWVSYLPKLSDEELADVLQYMLDEAEKRKKLV